MNVRRGDVILARFPHAAGGRGKKRPVVVVQSDVYNLSLRQAVVAEVTTNVALAADPANLFVEARTTEGRATGLTRDSVVTCLYLSTISADRADRVIGQLSAPLMQKLDACLKAALGL